MTSPIQWTWVWASSGRWWRTGKPGVLQSMGSKRVRHDWGAEQQSNGNKNKLKKWSLIKLKNFCIAKETIKKYIKKRERTTHRMGENIYKWCKQQGVDLQNLQMAHVAQYQKHKQPSQKIDKRSRHYSKGGWPRGTWNDFQHH